MEQLCPNAILLNFSNPEHKICEALTRLTFIKAVGLCHGVFMGREQLSKLLEVPLTDLQTKACGINHFTWFQEIKQKSTGEDLYPKLKEIEQKGDWLADWHELALGRILFRRFGQWPSPASNHYGEYLRWAGEFVIPQLQFFYDPYDGHPWENNQIPEGVYTVDRVNYDREWTKDWTKKLLPVGSTEEIQLQNEDGSFKSSGEIATLIMESVVTDKKEWLEAVNVPNKGTIPNLPDDLVVEVPAYSDASGIHPVKMQAIPEGIAATIRLHASIHQLLVEAYHEQSKDKLLQAILIEPTVNSYRNAVQMCNEMLSLQKEVLPPLN
jgi:alpha-galactosidase